MKLNSIRFSLFNRVYASFFIGCVIILFLFSNFTSSAASVSKELENNTTFLIEEYKEYKQITITVTVYDRVTGEPIGDIKVELYYKDSDNSITGSEGQYLTDKDGVIRYEISSFSKGDNYHFEIDTPGYFPYVGEDFIVTGDMNIVIYLDPLPEEGLEPDVMPEVEPEPEIPEPEVPEPEEEQQPLPEDDKDEPGTKPQTGDSTSVLYYAMIAMTSVLIYLLLVLLKKRSEDEEVL